MGAFGTIAVVVVCVVINLSHRHVKHTSCLLYLTGDAWQIGDSKGCSILFNNIHKRYIIEIQLIIHYLKFLCRKISGLLNQINIFVLHNLKFPTSP